MPQSGWVLDIDRFASHDGPGIRTTIFLKGCPLSCVWCHSPESQAPGAELLYRADRCTACWLCLESCPSGALSKSEGAVVLDRSLCDGCGECCEVCYPGALEIAGKRMTVDEIVDRVGRDAAFFRNSGGGVTISGGEPLFQPEFSYQLLTAFKDRDIHTAVETTGIVSWEVISRASDVTDLFLFDLKILDDDLHRRYVGSSNKMILKNLERLCAARDGVQVRVPCIPGINDSEDQIRDLSVVVAAAGGCKIALLPYNSSASAKYTWIDRPFELAGFKRQEEHQMEILADICRDNGLETEIVG